MSPGAARLQARLVPILGALLVLAVADARGQVAFQPVVSSFPDGVGLTAAPVVSADRRYVRLGVTPVFTGLLGFDSYSVPAAVGGTGLTAGLDGVNAGPQGGGLAAVGLGPGRQAPLSPEAMALLNGRAGLPPAPSLSARGLAPAPTPHATTSKAKRPTRPRRR